MESICEIDEIFLILINKINDRKDIESLKFTSKTTLASYNRLRTSSVFYFGCPDEYKFYGNYRLRDYQTDTLNYLWKTEDLVNLIVLPTRSGKVVTSLIYCYERYKKYGGVSILALPKWMIERAEREVVGIWGVGNDRIFHANFVSPHVSGVIVCERSKLKLINLSLAHTLVIHDPESCTNSSNKLIECIKENDNTRIVLMSYKNLFFPKNSEGITILPKSLSSTQLLCSLYEPEITLYTPEVHYYPIALEEETNFSVCCSKESLELCSKREKQFHPLPNRSDFITYYNGKKREKTEAYERSLNVAQIKNRELNKKIATLIDVLEVCSKSVLVVVDIPEFRIYLEDVVKIPVVDISSNRRTDYLLVKDLIIFLCDSHPSKLRRAIEIVASESNKNTQINVWLLLTNTSLLFATITDKTILQEYYDEMSRGKKKQVKTNISKTHKSYFLPNMTSREIIALSYHTFNTVRSVQWVQEEMFAYKDCKELEIALRSDMPIQVRNPVEVKDVVRYEISSPRKKEVDEKIDIEKLEESYYSPRGGYTIIELRKICYRMGMSAKGKKHELAERIAEAL